MDVGVLVVIVLAVGFAFSNGFHDAANAVATSVSTRALTPRIAVLLAALANVVGAFFAADLAATVVRSIIATPDATIGVAVCSCALFGALAWNLITWRRGLPSSSTHALLGGLVAVALVAGVQVRWSELISSVLIPLLVSPIAGAVAAGLLLLGITRWVGHAPARQLNRQFRYAQTISAAAMALGHGMQDAAKSAGVLVIALVATGHLAPGSATPMWALVLMAVAISLGTYVGGWRIIRTLGQRISHLNASQGFAAEAASSAMLFLATALHLPISTTQSITAAIAGVGAVRRPGSVRLRVARDIVAAWLLTLPAAGAMAAALYALWSLTFG